MDSADDEENNRSVTPRTNFRNYIVYDYMYSNHDSEHNKNLVHHYIERHGGFFTKFAIRFMLLHLHGEIQNLKENIKKNDEEITNNWLKNKLANKITEKNVEVDAILDDLIDKVLDNETMDDKS